MNDLGFKIIDKPHAPGYTVAWVQSDSGLLRRATDEEVKLWEALREARTVQAQREAVKGRK